MDDIGSRFRAKMVTYVDLVLSCLCLLVLIGLVLFCAAVTAVVRNDPERKQQVNKRGTFDEDSHIWNDNKTIQQFHRQRIFDERPDFAKSITYAAVAVMWEIVAIYALFTVFHMWAVIKLLVPSEPEMQPSDALWKACFWRNVTFLLFVLSVICGVVIMAWLSLFIIVLWHSTTFLVVYYLIKEFESIMISQSDVAKSYLGGVIIRKHEFWSSENDQQKLVK